jgi:hypothetical protein
VLVGPVRLGRGAGAEEDYQDCEETHARIL